MRQHIDTGDGMGDLKDLRGQRQATNDLSCLVPDGGLTVQAVALMDLGLRTAVASLVTVSGAPMALGMVRRQHERAAMDFYAALGAGADAASIFPAPPPDVPVRARPAGKPPWAPGVGTRRSPQLHQPLPGALFADARGLRVAHPQRHGVGPALAPRGRAAADNPGGARICRVPVLAEQFLLRPAPGSTGTDAMSSWSRCHTTADGATAARPTADTDCLPTGWGTSPKR